MPEPCPFRAACGGCPAMDVPVDEALARKAARVAAAVGRPVDRVHASPREVGYRARVRLRADAAGRLGYHRPRTHDHVPIPRCAIARPEIGAVLQALPLLPALDQVELRTDGTRVVAATTRRAAGPGALDALVRGVAGVALAGRGVAGDVDLKLPVHGVEHVVGPESFFQVNLEVNLALVGAVLEAARSTRPEAVLDLYAGIGNLSLPLAADGLPVTLWEESEAALDDARRTAGRQALAVRTRRARAEAFRAGDVAFDLALLDPPRTGAPGVLSQVLLTRPRAVLYVSCNPHTLARDLRAALGRGYDIDRLEVFDMFPHTFHVETLCVLRRC